jgi:hypothetical protein
MLLKNMASIVTKSNDAIKGIYSLLKYQSLGYRNLLNCYTPPIPFLVIKIFVIKPFYYF